MAPPPKPPKPITLFCGYAREDKAFRDQFYKFARVLIREAPLKFWYDGEIVPGEDWDAEIKKQLNKSNLIVFLVSADLLNSDYAYDVEMRRARELEQEGKAVVVPIIIKVCDWEHTFIRKNQALPSDCLPVKKWIERDEAWTDVVNGLWRAVEKLRYKGEEEGRANEETIATPIAPLQKKVAPTIKSERPIRLKVGNTPILIVDPEDNKDYQTINEALAAAPAGARIVVRPGKYQEGIVLDKNVEIIGDGSLGEIVVINRKFDCVLMATSYAKIANLTLICEAGESGKNFFGVDIPMGKLCLENCDISSDAMPCIAINNPGTDPFVVNCRIHGSQQGGVWVLGGGQGHFDGCEIYDNALSGVDISGGSNPVFTKCFIHNGKQNGVLIHKEGRGVFENCIIDNNAFSGIVVRQRAQPLVTRCRIRNNGYQGIRVINDGGGTFLENDLTDNVLGPWKMENAGPLTRKDNREKA